MNRLQAHLCLICVTLCWSTEVIIFACIPNDVLPFATSFITSAIAVLILVASFFKRIKAEMKRNAKRILLRCVFLGIIKCGYDVLFLYGLNYFDVSTGAFTFSITVVVLPVILLTMKKNVSPKTWLSALLVLAGIVCALGSQVFGNQIIGLMLMLIGCILRAVFIIKLNDFAKEHDSITLSVLISSIGAAISFCIWMFLQPQTFGAIEWSPTIIASLFIYAYFIVAFAQTLNIFAQKRATASGATVIYSLEIVFSLIWSAVLPETLIDRVIPTPFQVIGALLIVAGSIIEIVDFDFKGRRKHEVKKQEL